MNRALLAIVIAAFSAPIIAQPSLILLNGKVFTGDAAKPAAEAVAIEGSRITAVGTTRDIAALAGEKTAVIDAGGRVIIPGINDAHTHPGFAMTAFRPDLGLDPTWSQVAAAVSAAADETPADFWTMVEVGPKVLLDASITRESLDKLAPNRKVVLQAFTGHGMVMSTAAMKALGVQPDTADPAGGWFVRNDAGQINGRAYEYAQFPLVNRLSGMASDDELVEAVRMFSDEALGYGITSVQSMPIVDTERFIKALAAANVPLRVRVINFMMRPDQPLVAGASGVKWILDGTPIERNAALRKPYAGGGEGRLNFRDLEPLIKTGTDANQQILMHAVGDRTIATLLEAMNTSGTDWPARRLRIEHADGLAADLFPSAKRHGVIAVLNPSHFPFRGAFPAGDYSPARSLVKAGIPIAIGSDGPLNPYLNVMFAAGHGDQALTREQAIIAYTAGSAFAEFTEKEKGKIAPGMLADLAVLSQDIFTVPAAALPDTKSVLTIIDGKIVHSSL